MRLLAVTCLILGCVLAACSPNLDVEAPRERRGISTAIVDRYIAAPPHALDVLQPNAAPLKIALAPVRLLRVRVCDSDTLAQIAARLVSVPSSPSRTR